MLIFEDKLILERLNQLTRTKHNWKKWMGLTNLYALSHQEAAFVLVAKTLTFSRDLQFTANKGRNKCESIQGLGDKDVWENTVKVEDPPGKRGCDACGSHPRRQWPTPTSCSAPSTYQRSARRRAPPATRSPLRRSSSSSSAAATTTWSTPQAPTSSSSSPPTPSPTTSPASQAFETYK